jgi:hypothetical protein
MWPYVLSVVMALAWRIRFWTTFTSAPDAMSRLAPTNGRHD